jgi:hypothetical protein
MINIGQFLPAIDPTDLATKSVANYCSLRPPYTISHAMLAMLLHAYFQQNKKLRTPKGFRCH